MLAIGQYTVGTGDIINNTPTVPAFREVLSDILVLLLDISAAVSGEEGKRIHMRI